MMKESFFKRYSIQIISVLIAIIVFLLLFIFVINSDKKNTSDDYTGKPISLVGTYEYKNQLYKQPETLKTALFVVTNNNNIEYLILFAVDDKNKTIKPIHINTNIVCHYNIIDGFGKIIGNSTGSIKTSYASNVDPLVSLNNVKNTINDLFCNIRIDYCLSIDLKSIDYITKKIGNLVVTLRNDYTDIDPAYTKGAKVNVSSDNVLDFLLIEDLDEKSQLRASDYLVSFFEACRDKYNSNDDYISKTFAEVSEYCIVNSNDFVSFVEESVGYTLLNSAVPKGYMDDNKTFVVDLLSVEDICLQNIYLTN